MNELTWLVEELEATAERLRRGDVDAEGGAELVDRCAELASRLGAELDRQARAAAAEPAPGQETLL